MTKTRIYRAMVKTPFGKYEIIVDSNDEGCLRDIREAARHEFRVPMALVTVVGQPNKSNRRVLSSATSIKGCYIDGEAWAWIR